MGLLARKVRDDRGRVYELYGTGRGIGSRTDAQTLSAAEYRRIRGRAKRALGPLRENPRYVGPGWGVLGRVLLTVALWVAAAAIVVAASQWMNGGYAILATCALVSVLSVLMTWRGFGRILFPVAIADAIL